MKSGTNVGAYIRAIRRQRGLTLEQVSSKAGLDKSHLSRIERGGKYPSVASLVQIADALGVKVAHLLGETTLDSTVSIVRANERKRVSPVTPGGLMADEALITADPMRSIEAFVVYPAREPETQDLVEHQGEEMIFVLTGEIELQLADRSIVLGAGDCVHFLGKLKHKLRQKSRARATALVVIARG